MNNQETKLGMKHYIIIGSMLFGMFFGAGNLIFPIHLGQLAGSNWLIAGIGFLLTGTLLPLLAIIAISVTRSSGIYDLAKPIGSKYATFFMLLVCATLGPLFATPRTATVPFQIGFASHLSKADQPLWLFIYSLIFFGITYWASRKPTNIINTIGKLLNPAFLILLAIIFGFAFSQPIHGGNSMTPSTGYGNAAMLNGFLQGYNTMDCIAGLLFGIAIVTAIKGLGAKSPRQISMTTLKSGLLGIGLEAIIYIGLIWLGSTSLSMFKTSIDGGIAFNQIANHYLGMTGQIILAIMATLTCLTTAVGLSASFSEALHRKFPNISYRTFNIMAVGFSFAFANVGLDTIIAWSTPMLMFLYPLAITLIILSITSPLFNKDRRVYIWTTIFTIIPAILDAIASAPAIISKSAIAQGILKLDNFLPGASLGMDWLLPAGIGLAIGLIIHFATSFSGEKATEIEHE
ncbi:branched-chain amino acid transport system II carrier protein [Lentilactobacillus curieae]|uniref:Branched-chain amino acid transport system carrier protein n=1 Tax=Lentilactobacillus curieae TaxID=1138822 RepID=A0A1S6QHT3_9LACO|nr:branched-chain amino acid transport system II carrier protein [Lentilactobacillus curieae]AQW21174.1 branched-chain amino acid transport system II carrier protein [Lentilactobacillus curieae]